jgi:hypothetical protein
MRYNQVLCSGTWSRRNQRAVYPTDTPRALWPFRRSELMSSTTVRNVEYSAYRAAVPSTLVLWSPPASW